MLERILDIHGIGLFHQANGKPHTCHKATLIYSDNARGKSTLASVLKSVSTGDASFINDRKTIDGTLPPKVLLHFSNGHQITFDNGTWSESRSEVLVFDANFIERNVHSGSTVSTTHRKNLLEFALGESAVTARNKLDKATNDAKMATDCVQQLANQLSGHHVGMSLDQFENLPKIDNIDMKLNELKKKISEANNMSGILSKPVPTVIAEPTFNIEDLFTELAISLEDIHKEAEHVVKEHIAALGNKNAENWLSQGQQFRDNEFCPYCGQETSTNDLISAYRTHFNTAYRDLKARALKIHENITVATAASIVDNFSQSVATAAAQAIAWAEHVQISTPMFDIELAHFAMTKLRTLMHDLSLKKQASPAEAIGTEAEKNEAAALWREIITLMQNANLAIKEVAELINVYKAKLVADNIQQLQQQEQQLQISKRRYDINIIEMIDQIRNLRLAADQAESVKKAARDSLDSIMKTTLDQYEISIKKLLQDFGASFTIEGMSANFRGTGPRSEYGLLLRGKNVALEKGSPSFATALSEGDKRTLAFAFFVASTLADPKLAERIVVIDDPMSSLDLNRKHHTKIILKQIHSKAKQLIVLAHDLYFIRDLRDALRKNDEAAQIAVFQLALDQRNYTNFAPFDVDKECESIYFRHHRLLNDFMAGNVRDDMSVAKAIRPMLEGYLHRRFPTIIPKNLLFGEIVALIRRATAPNPLCHAQNLIDELNEINDYAGKFHHDSNANAVHITVTELKTYVIRALNVVHKGSGFN